MGKMNKFRIRSKKDAKYFIQVLKNNSNDFTYEVPLMGINGGLVTVSFPVQEKEGKIISTSSGYHNENSFPMPRIVNFVWNDRKHINKELRYNGPIFIENSKRKK